MKATKATPLYNAVIINKAGRKIGVKKVITELQLTEYEKDLAEKVVITVINVKVDGKLLSSQVKAGDRLYVYANNGSGYKEVFRGFIWEEKYVSQDNNTITYTCYDMLIYLQQSKDNFYFPAKKKSLTILKQICGKWGLPIVYNYRSISHKKRIFRQEKISDCILSILEDVRKETGIKYVIYSKKDKIYINAVAQNKTCYEINKKQNAAGIMRNTSMNEMVTRVVIIGNEKKEGRPPVLATVKGNEKSYGTLQEIVQKEEKTSLKTVKKEAQHLIKDRGKPITKFTIETTDLPFVKKGNQIKVNAGGVSGLYVVLGIEHDAVAKTMNLEVEKKK